MTNLEHPYTEEQQWLDWWLYPRFRRAGQFFRWGLISRQAFLNCVADLAEFAHSDLADEIRTDGPAGQGWAANALNGMFRLPDGSIELWGYRVVGPICISGEN